MAKTVTIALGFKIEASNEGTEIEVPITYTVRRLTLEQSRDVGVGMFPDTPDTLAGNFTFNFEQAMNVVLAALARDFAQITREKLMKDEVSWPQLDQARNQILAFSGYRTEKVANEAGAQAPGEQAPGAA